MTQASDWAPTGVALALFVISGIGDWRRMNRRKSIDHVGWVPWRGIQAATLFAALASLMIALKG
jgi:hypothetical protein